MARFTWTYGASERKTIFINDNTLQDPKGNGIGAITCHRIGNKEAERLANLFVASEDLLEACKTTLTEILRLNEMIADALDAHGVEIVNDEGKPTTAISSAREIRILEAAIAKAEGKEVKDV